MKKISRLVSCWFYCITINTRQIPFQLKYILFVGNRSSHPKKSVTNKESCKEFLEDFGDYDSDDLNERYVRCILHDLY